MISLFICLGFNNSRSKVATTDYGPLHRINGRRREHFPRLAVFFSSIQFVNSVTSTVGTLHHLINISKLNWSGVLKTRRQFVNPLQNLVNELSVPIARPVERYFNSKKVNSKQPDLENLESDFD